ncbi:hypothetical protein ACOMHN_043904 [Nucella lapillus]
MPLPCVEEQEEEQHSYNHVVSQAVVKVVIQGMEEERVTCGIQKCVQLMESLAENVMLCVLVQQSATLKADVKIPLLLIRAFCQENTIHLLHVQGQHKMTQLLSTCLSQSTKRCTDDVRAPPIPTPVQEDNGSGLGCIMIKFPKGNTSFEDDFVMDYIKDQMQNYTEPSVAIPDLMHTGKDEILGSHFKLKRSKMKTPIQASSQPTSSY